MGNTLGKFNLDGIPPMPRGQAQIDVCFDIDANGILNVSALEKSTGKQNKITITNDKGRLSQDEIERMVFEGEKYKADDDANRNRIESKNALDNYCYSLKRSMSGDEVASKMDPVDKTSLEGKIKETIAGSTATLRPKRRNTKRSKRSSKVLPCLSFKRWGVLLEQEACSIWMVCQEVHPEAPLPAKILLEDLPSRKLIRHRLLSPYIF